MGDQSLAANRCVVYIDFENLGYKRALALLWQIRIEEGSLICKVYSHRPVNKLQKVSAWFSDVLEIYKHADGTPNASDRRTQADIEDLSFREPDIRFYILSGDTVFKSITTPLGHADTFIQQRGLRPFSLSKADIHIITKAVECLHSQLKCHQGVRLAQLGQALRQIKGFNYPIMGASSLTVLLQLLSNRVQIFEGCAKRKPGIHL